MESLGGYRLVRKLGAGANSEVWLGSDAATTVALKVYRAEADGARIDAEIEALGRASHRHILRLEDLAMGPGGFPCLVLQRLSALSLAAMLARSTPTPGEAVTILVPLVRAVAELHRVGVAHGALRPSSVLFDDSGAPVLARLGGAILFGEFPPEGGVSLPPARMSVDASVAQDLAGLSAICRATLPGDEELSRWLSDSSSHDGSEFADELVERLFAIAEPAPVRMELLRGHDGSTRPMRQGGIPERIDGLTGPGAAPVPAPPLTSELASLLHLPDEATDSITGWLGRILERGPISALKTRIIELLKPVRKPVWIIAGLVTVAIVVVAAVLPANTADANHDSIVATETPAVVVPAVSAAVSGDDPVIAVLALLEARAGCFAAMSVLCLDAVDQQGSAAMSADAAQIRLLQVGGIAEGSTAVQPGSLPRASGRLTAGVVERLGDSVLLALADESATDDSSGFSVLLIRIDEEWRIRDVLAAGGATG